VAERRKRSLGRDPFEDTKEAPASDTVAKLIRGRSLLSPDAKEVEVVVRLTPAVLKHIDALRARLGERGRDVSRDELIRIAITLLTPDDVA
jgi:hypothetical protein